MSGVHGMDGAGDAWRSPEPAETGDSSRPDRRADDRDAWASTANGPRISVVVPVYNSEATIERLCEELIRDLVPAQIVLINDGSTDGSAAICRRVHERFPDVVDFVSLSRNFGEHNAVMAGLNQAVGDFCVIMDDDLQNPAAEATRLVTEIVKGYDVVYVRYETKHHSLFRNLGSRFHNWMATRVLDKPADLYLSSFKILSRFVVREVVGYEGPDPYLDAIILRTTRRIGVIASHHEPRKQGKSGYTLGKLISLWGNMVVSFSMYPVRLLGMWGLIMALVGIAVGTWTLIAFISPHIENPDSLQQLNASMWFFRGLHLFFLSVVAEYVGRIYRQLNHDPQFIVREMRRRAGVAPMIPTPKRASPATQTEERNTEGSYATA